LAVQRSVHGAAYSSPLAVKGLFWSLDSISTS